MQTIDKRSNLTKTLLLYLVQESKRGFRGWSKEGLEFLVHRYKLQKRMEKKCSRAIVKLAQLQRGRTYQGAEARDTEAAYRVSCRYRQASY